MNLPQVRELVALMRDHMHETTMRDGLIKNIESGHYDVHRGKSSLIILRAQLNTLHAPSAIMEKLAEFRNSNFRPIPPIIHIDTVELAASDFAGDINMGDLDTEAVDEVMLVN